MRFTVAATVAAVLIDGSSAYQLATAARPARAVAAPSMMPVAPQAVQAGFPSRAAVVMQGESGQDFYEGYVQTDPVTGESTSLDLDEKEKLYLECLDAFYNENGKQLLGDEEYNQLKIDLDFEGAKIVTFTKDEIKFVLANKRYKMGKPILNDAEYDELRGRLKAAGSTVIIHEGAKCNVEDGICKTDLAIDAGKTRLLYLPGSLGGLLLVQEAFFWTVGLDPIISTVLGLIPAYFFGIWFTENVFAQKPLVVQAGCTNCGYLNTVFFGDLFSVATDGLVPDALTIDSVNCKCPNCKKEVRAGLCCCHRLRHRHDGHRDSRHAPLPPLHDVCPSPRLTIPCWFLCSCAQLVADRATMIIQTKEPVAAA